MSQATDGKTFIDIKISNQAGRDIVLMSSDKMPPKGLTIIKGVMLDFVKQFSGAAKVTFTAKDVMTGQLIYLNGKKSITLTASSVKGHKFTIFATTKPGQISTGNLPWFVSEPNRSLFRSSKNHLLLVQCYYRRKPEYLEKTYHVW